MQKGPFPQTPFPQNLNGRTSGKTRERLNASCSRSLYTFPNSPPKVLERWGPGGGKPFSKGFLPPQKPSLQESPRFPRGTPGEGSPPSSVLGDAGRPSCALRGRRISSSAEDDGGAAPRPRRLLQKAGENLGAASPLTRSNTKNKGTAARFLQPFPFYAPHLLPKVLERWGRGGGKPFSKGFPPPQEPSPAGTFPRKNLSKKALAR